MASSTLCVYWMLVRSWREFDFKVWRLKQLMKTVITYGTFDLFHVGHVRLLKRLRGLGDQLVVGLSTDDFNSVKGKRCVIPYGERKEVLLSCRYVDNVFPESSWEQKPDDIIKYKADIFAMGDDWSGKFDFMQNIVEVVYLPRTEGISTTEIKQIVSSLNRDKLISVQHVVENALEQIKSIKL